MNANNAGTITVKHEKVASTIELIAVAAWNIKKYAKHAHIQRAGMLIITFLDKKCDSLCKLSLSFSLILLKQKIKHSNRLGYYLSFKGDKMNNDLNRLISTAKGPRVIGNITQTLIQAQAQMQIIDNKEIFFEGCKGILGYTENQVTVKLSRINVMVTGISLIMENYNSGGLTIRGTLHSIEFVTRGEEDAL